ncbi:HesA/MoeB/ThiF family protein [Pedobacter heparinus]|uniref:HesA/MoeB/ThiF family protein n=1 Tax=Pedobacter heparinus TaxID=984 RepID=UPI00292CC816|nr:HesA/MoeB/ThiF family protein [Pedobacter heparinus]
MKRYERQIILPEIGWNGQQKLAAAKVLVIGAGGLGCPVLLYLAGAGLGCLGIVDHDVVAESNLHRQVLYQMADIGKPKAEIAAARLGLLNPDVELRAYAFRLTADNAAELIGQYDLVIDGADNFPTRYLVNDTCVQLDKTSVFGSIFQFEGQVSVFNDRGGPDYRALYPEPPLPDEVPNCGEAGVIGTLPGIIGSMMANEAIKLIAGFGEPLSGKLLIYNALNNDTQLFNFNSPAKTKPGRIDGPVEIPLESATEIPLAKTSDQDPAQLSLAVLSQWKKDNIAYQLIDVREVYEYEEYNMGGLNIPLYDLSRHLSGLLHHEKIVFCCSVGTRSKIAMNLMKQTFKGEIYTAIVAATMDRV